MFHRSPVLAHIFLFQKRAELAEVRRTNCDIFGRLEIFQSCRVPLVQKLHWPTRTDRFEQQVFNPSSSFGHFHDFFEALSDGGFTSHWNMCLVVVVDHVLKSAHRNSLNLASSNHPIQILFESVNVRGSQISDEVFIDFCCREGFVGDPDKPFENHLKEAVLNYFNSKHFHLPTSSGLFFFSMKPLRQSWCAYRGIQLTPLGLCSMIAGSCHVKASPDHYG